jgi:3-isopropylmalate dehydrogenase
MALRYSFGRSDDAKLLERAVERVLADGYRTADIMQAGMTQLGTTEMTSQILKALDRLAA